MRCAWVKIDLDRLSLRLRVTLGRTLTDWDVRQWLEREGFKWGGGPWYACPYTLSALKPDEILARQTRETINGITFVENESTRPADDRNVY